MLNKFMFSLLYNKNRCLTENFFIRKYPFFVFIMKSEKETHSLENLPVSIENL